MKEVKKRATRAITILEILVVMAIVGLLVALVSSVSSNGIFGAKLSQDMANLHQIGVGAELYKADYDHLMTYSVTKVVESGRVPAYVDTSPNDSTHLGLDNEYTKVRGNAPVPYKASYVSFNTLNSQRDLEGESVSGKTGWAIALIPPYDTKPGSGLNLVLPGDRYLRLRLDGGVEQRRTPWTVRPESGGRQISFLQMFLE